MAETNEVWTEAHARRVLDAWSKSGLTMTEFARRERVRVQRLFWWRDRLGLAKGRRSAETRKAEVKEAPAARFAPAVVKRAPRVTVGGAATIVITTRSGRTIEIAEPARVAPSWIGAVVRELERTR